jgi:ankyrin repeat protein
MADLTQACLSGDLNKIILMHETNPHLDVMYRDDKTGRTLMWVSCAYGHIEIAKWLHANGASEDIWTMDDSSRSPLWISAAYGHLQICKWLVEVGAGGDVRIQDDKCRSPFWMACFGGHLDVVQWLFEMNLEDDIISKDDHSNQTPFAITCINGI